MIPAVRGMLFRALKHDKDKARVAAGREGMEARAARLYGRASIISEKLTVGVEERESLPLHETTKVRVFIT